MGISPSQYNQVHLKTNIKPFKVGGNGRHFIGSRLGLLHVWNMYLVGGILTPPKNMKVKWDYCSQYMKNIYNMFQTTNQVQFLSNISYPAKNVRFFAGELVDNPIYQKTILDEFLHISD
jgi:hypothetical protein